MKKLLTVVPLKQTVIHMEKYMVKKLKEYGIKSYVYFDQNSFEGHA